jgi:hypothetical protein
MGVESVQHVERHQGLAVVGQQTHKGGLTVSKSLRGRLAYWSGRLRRFSCPGLALAGVGVPASAPTHSKLTQWLTCNSKTYQHRERWLLRGWKLLFCNTAPLCMSPTPRARHLSAEKHPFRETQDTCIDPHATDEPRGGFIFRLPWLCRLGLDQSQTLEGHRKIEGIPTRPLVKARRSNTTVSQARVGRSGRDGVMLQGAPVSTDLGSLSDRAGSDAATSDHQTEPTSVLHPESTPP